MRGCLHEMKKIMEAAEFCNEYNFFSCVSTIVTLSSINLLNLIIYAQRNKTDGS